MRGDPHGTALHNHHHLQHGPGIEKEDKDPLAHLNDGQRAHSLSENRHLGARAKASYTSPQLLCNQVCEVTLMVPSVLRLMLLSIVHHPRGIVGLTSSQMTCALRGEQAQHQQSDAPRRGQNLLQKRRKDFVPGDDSFFQVPCCSPKERRKAALPEGCSAALHRCQGACKSSAQGICSSTRQSHLSIRHQNTREKCPEHIPGRQTSSQSALQNPPAKRLSSNS